MEPSQTAHFTFTRRHLWMPIGAPWNLDATLNGKTVLPMDTAAAIVLILLVVILPAAIVAGLFIWAAIKDGARAAPHPELVVNVLEVRSDSRGRDEEPAADLAVRQALCNLAIWNLAYLF